MNTKTQQTPLPETQAAPAVVPAPPWKEIVPLSRVLFSIGRDSRRQPENYLDEVVVPHGGE